MSVGLGEKSGGVLGELTLPAPRTLTIKALKPTTNRRRERIEKERGVERVCRERPTMKQTKVID